MLSPPIDQRRFLRIFEPETRLTKANKGRGPNVEGIIHLPPSHLIQRHIRIASRSGDRLVLVRTNFSAIVRHGQWHLCQRCWATRTLPVYKLYNRRSARTTVASCLCYLCIAAKTRRTGGSSSQDNDGLACCCHGILRRERFGFHRFCVLQL